MNYSKSLATTINLSPVEVVAPFFIAILVLVISVVLAPEIVKMLTEHYGEGWSEKEKKDTPNNRTPETHAKAVVWAIDLAQIPVVILSAIAGVIVAHKAYSSVAWLAYTVLLVVGLLVYAYYKRRVKISNYWERGRELLGYRITPLVIGGIALNVAGAIAAVVVVKS